MAASTTSTVWLKRALKDRCSAVGHANPHLLELHPIRHHRRRPPPRAAAIHASLFDTTQ